MRATPRTTPLPLALCLPIAAGVCLGGHDPLDVTLIDREELAAIEHGAVGGEELDITDGDEGLGLLVETILEPPIDVVEENPTNAVGIGLDDGRDPMLAHLVAEDFPVVIDASDQ